MAERWWDKKYFSQINAQIPHSFVQILLITSKTSHEKWIIPGGGLNSNETAEAAVVREAYEEAGVLCDNVKYLGLVQVILKFQSRFWNTNVTLDSIRKVTEVFRLNVIELVDEWEESKANKRVRQWFSIDEAYNLLNNYRPEQLAYLNLLL